MIRCRTRSMIDAFRGALPAKGDAPLLQRLPLIGHRWFSADSDPETREISNPRVLELADAITQLNMLEVSDLTEVLRRRLNLQLPSFGVPMGMAAPTMAGGMPASGAAAATETKAVEEKTEFDVKLEGFDAAAKIKVIKEVRGMTDLGLKEAKDLVENAPVLIKKGLGREEAEQLKAKLEAAGAKVLLE